MGKDEDNVVKFKDDAFEIQCLKHFKKEGFNYIISDYDECEMYITTTLISIGLVNVTDFINIADFSFIFKKENDGKRLKIDEVLKGISK